MSMTSKRMKKWLRIMSRRLSPIWWIASILIGEEIELARGFANYKIGECTDENYDEWQDAFRERLDELIVIKSRK